MKKFLLLAVFSISSICTLLFGSNMLTAKESIAAEQQAKQSGIYSYIMVGQDMQPYTDGVQNGISITGIDTQSEKVIIPEQIDGHPVVGIGTLYSVEEIYLENIDTACLAGTGRDHIKELVFPDSVMYIGSGAFRDFQNLQNITLPGKVKVIGDYAFAGCDRLQRLDIPPYARIRNHAFDMKGKLSTVNVTSQTVLGYYTFGSHDIEGNAQIDRMNIMKGTGTMQDVGSGRIQSMYVQKGIERLNLSPDEGADFSVAHLYINGKNTTLLNEQSYANEKEMSKIGMIHTVKGAKAIKLARKQKITYQVKETGKVTVKYKKKKGKRKVTWNAVKTVVHTYKYQKNKWTVKSKKSKTTYLVYGKNKKSGKYKLIQTTKKRSFVSKYRYVKVVAEKDWK